MISPLKQKHYQCNFFTKYFQILFRPVGNEIGIITDGKIYYVLQSSFFYHAVLESELFFLVLFINCSGYNLIIAQANPPPLNKIIILVIKREKNHIE